ncbi:TPA: hypothetical protein ACPWS4_003872, partial [Pseudomonas aeruginosa]
MNVHGTVGGLLGECFCLELVLGHEPWLCSLDRAAGRRGANALWLPVVIDRLCLDLALRVRYRKSSIGRWLAGIETTAFSLGEVDRLVTIERF